MNIKTIATAVTICLILFCIKSYAQVDSGKQLLPCQIKKQQMIDHLTKAFLDPEIMIGVFEKPGMKDLRARYLKSGIRPELEKDYLHYMISSNLIKLSTQSIIKGDFDSLIFIKFPSFVISGSNEAFESNPKFHEGSVWVLLLERAFNKDGSSKMEWAGKLNNENNKLFNETTLFLDAFETYYALCLKWPAEISKSPKIITIEEKMVTDLLAIAKIMELKNKENKTEALKSMLEKNECLNECSRLIVEKLLTSITITRQ